MFLFLQLVNNQNMQMRTRKSSIIVGLLLVLMPVTSCLDSNQITEFSTNATITEFGIDAIYGVDYKFEIDQIRNVIFNRDSLPVSADTILDKTLVTTLECRGMYVLSGDTLFSTEDSVNLLPAVNKSGSEGMKFTVYANDGTTNRTYTLQIRMHQQEPDSLVWRNMAEIGPVFDAGNRGIPQKAVVLGDELLVYTTPRALYRTYTSQDRYSVTDEGRGWYEPELTGLPDDAQFSSIVSYKGALYLIGEGGGEVYRSVDGAAWEVAPELGDNVVALIAPTNPNDEQDNRLAAVVEVNGQKYFNVWDGTAWGDAVETVPENFPLANIYSTHSVNGTGVTKLVIVGQTPASSATVPWATEDGMVWADYSVAVAECPWMNNPFIAYYGDMFCIFGGDMDEIYYSRNGLAWYVTARNFLLPKSFAGNTNYAIAIDPTVDEAEKHDYIWVVLGGNSSNNEVWRGRLNKLGFAVQ